MELENWLPVITDTLAGKHDDSLLPTQRRIVQGLARFPWDRAARAACSRLLNLLKAEARLAYERRVEIGRNQT